MTKTFEVRYRSGNSQIAVEEVTAGSVSIEDGVLIFHDATVTLDDTPTRAYKEWLSLDRLD